ncbi:MAG TPA: hypothetical protein VHP37_10950 [Burkholderiales bacterium]|nr:hypothetical protein [Burkholderiales bacterium]
MKKLIAAVIASAFAFGVAGSSFAADVQPQQAQHQVVKVKKSHKKAHKAHKKARKAHTAAKAPAPRMHQVKMVKKHGHKQVKKTVR